MDSKLSQKGWMSVATWLGLIGVTAFTSKSIIDLFTAIVQTLFQTLTNGIGDLFSNYGVLFATILGIVLIFLILSAWLSLVSYTYVVGQLVFGMSEKADDEDEEGDELDAVELFSGVVRYLTFSWGLFFILFLILPMVM